VQHGQAKVAAHHGDMEDDRLFRSYVVLFLMQRHAPMHHAYAEHALSWHGPYSAADSERNKQQQLMFELVVDGGLGGCYIVEYVAARV
jgi:hypothetical protein